jgi:hypothetical protein
MEMPPEAPRFHTFVIWTQGMWGVFFHRLGGRRMDTFFCNGICGRTGSHADGLPVIGRCGVPTTLPGRSASRWTRRTQAAPA